MVGLIITGGHTGASRSVEIIDIQNNRSCQLEDLPDDRRWHTQVWYQHRDWPYWHDCYRMATFCVVVVTLRTLASHGLMAPGLSVTILSMIDLNIPAGQLTLECCWLVGVAVSIQQRWSHGRGQLRHHSHWNMPASKNVDIESNVVMNNIFVVGHVLLTRRGTRFFWLVAITVLRRYPDMTSMATLRILMVSIMADVVMAAQDTPITMVTRLVQSLSWLVWYNLFRSILSVEESMALTTILIPVKRTLLAPDTGPTQHHYQDHWQDWEEWLWTTESWWQVSAAILSSVSSLYFVGGSDGSNYRDEILELVGSEWRQIATMQIARDVHAVTVINVEEYWKLELQGPLGPSF